jgi:8-oxo-dGTP pyrophosphatase MutT (NUDIX family)
MLMDLSNIQQVVMALRQRLEPVERADALRDALEGQRPNARKAAVLIGLFEQEGEATLIFIRRASTLRSHSGEIAFPGGAVDATDESPVGAALREAQEEIGLHPARAEVLGIMLPVFTVVSNFLITPVVAYLPQGPGELRLQASEVADLLLLPLRGLADPAIAHTEVWTRDGLARTVYFYDYGAYRVWGATARLLNALLGLLENHKS